MAGVMFVSQRAAKLTLSQKSLLFGPALPPDVRRGLCPAVRSYFGAMPLVRAFPDLLGHRPHHTQAKVIVAGKGDRRELTTDDEGFFQSNIQPGWYVITISHYGFQTRKLKLYLKPDVVTPLNVTLYPPSFKCPQGKIC